MAKVPRLSRLKEFLTIAEAAQYLSAPDEPVSEAEILRLAQEDVLQLSVQFLDTIYAEYIGEGPDYDAETDVRNPVGDEVFDLPMTGAGRLAVEETRRRHMGQTDVILHHADAMLVDDIVGSRYQLYYRAGDYSPVTRLPDHALLLVRREILDQLVSKAGGNERPAGPVGNRERETFLVMIAALCRIAKLDITKPTVVAKKIEAETIALGNRVADRTVLDHLAEVREVYGKQ